MRTLLLAAAVFVCCGATKGFAQAALSGHVSALGDYLPNRDDTTELRVRVFAEEKIEPSPRLRITLSGFVEGLAARRPTDTGGAAIARAHDANVELRAGRVDLLAGFARVAWGKLDELQPTDVINPLDISRFFFEGRSEARLPVTLVRGRVFITDEAILEGIVVPSYRRGRFDQLDEPTSPFNIIGPLPPGVIDREPDFGELQGGARFSATAGRVDLSVSAYRGFEPFGILGVTPALAIERAYPRFTLIGADFETVRGEWGVRGEFAAVVEDSFQSPLPALVKGSSFDAGVGVDRRAGDYRVSGTLLVHQELYDAPLDPRVSAETERTDVSLIASTDRSFARERYQVRVFGVYNASEASGFARAIGMVTLRDNVALEGSAGWFIGGGRDLVGRFSDSDFVYARLKYYF